MDMVLAIAANVMLGVCLSYYFMTAMQWYSYKIERVLFHYNRYDWHLYFFVLPLVGYYIFDSWLLILGCIVYGAVIGLWYKKIDRKLVFTARVKRFFLFFITLLLFQNVLFLGLNVFAKMGVFIPLILAHFISIVYEKILFESFKKKAQAKLMNSAKTVVAITASYGKTSIKNFLSHILSSKMTVYKTPRSVNTLAGIVKDINESLVPCDVYIVEAGARLKGDIDEIARFVNPHVAVVGSIGEQHIEYFKTLENIRNTKMELLHSNRLQKAFVHESAHAKGNENVSIFGSELKHVEATLDGLSFDMLINGQNEHFTCNLLGAFNAINLAAAIHVAVELGLSVQQIQASMMTLQGVEHRLQRIEAGGKLIIDDSFNGNLEGMLSSYDLVATYSGRKVIITPGIVEATEEANRTLAQKIDSIFDIVIITGKTNLKCLNEQITRAEKIVLSDKSELQSVLASHTMSGDVILFSNDAPNFI